MNRSFFNVILWMGATDQTSSSQTKEQKPVKNGNADDVAFDENASSVIIVPGYGMVVAQAQHALREMVDALKNGVKYLTLFILLQAERLDMNVIFAEANVPYDEVFELDEINNDFATVM